MSVDSGMIVADSTEFDDIRKRIAAALLDAAATQKEVTGRECEVHVTAEWDRVRIWSGSKLLGVRVKFSFTEL